MEEETYLKGRLALDDRAVKMLEKKIIYFLKSLYNEPVDSAQHQFENLLIQLLNYQTHLQRHPPIQVANDRDIAEYQNIIEKTVSIQAGAAVDIVSLKDDLKKAQKVRDHKLEYDRVARDIMKLSTRDTYKESIQSLSSDIELLKREKISKIAAFESRHDNLTLLVNNLKDLQQSVEEERNIKNEDKERLMDMERGYVSSDDEGDMGFSDDEPVEEEKILPAVNHRFQERNDEEDEEEGIVSDVPMVE
ncbi:hypothetical protein INT47_005466 [Mucor saturninus]|uniref:THO complex subunit 7 n=1 Tax=Mucor saturninus TaxID=64648 RepID=A0A8H7RD38_9FUNG|nr:hypothetical protein INT47_005466 [Mucor saturninus]